MASRVWTIPAARMKGGREHRVPLSGRALEILDKLAETRWSDLVFPGRHGQLSRSAVSALVPEDATVHGFRSSFRDWCGNETAFPREIAEACLAHATGDATERAYRRGDALEKRRKLMDAWAAHCAGEAAGNVVPLWRQVVQKTKVTNLEKQVGYRKAKAFAAGVSRATFYRRRGKSVSKLDDL